MSLCTRYTGSAQNRNGPAPSDANPHEFKFSVFGDTPYDPNDPYPFEGDEFACVRDTILPGVRSLADQIDWITHVGDIKKGGDPAAYPCDAGVFASRRDLFLAVEPDVDLLLLPGDNEYSAECAGWTPDATDSDPVQSLWRQYFTTGSFAGLDRELPVWGPPTTFFRQPNYPENWFMYYGAAPLDLAIFGITEPAGDGQYNAINADFIQTELANLGASAPSAIVIFGHADLEDESNHAVLDVLFSDSNTNIPTLYVYGNDHKYQMDFMAPERHPKLMALTVEAFKSAPLLVDLVDVEGDKYFHVQRADISC